MARASKKVSGALRLTTLGAWTTLRRAVLIRPDSTWSPVSPTTETPAPAKAPAKRTKRSSTAPSDGMRLVIVESPAKAKTIAGYLGAGLHRRGEHRPHPRPAAQRGGRPGEVQGRGLGPARRRRRQRLRAAVRREPGPQGAGHEAQGAHQGRHRALPRHRRGPRGRGDRLAPDRDAEAEDPRPAHGLPRDHPERHRAGREEPARPRPGAGGRPGDAAHPRPAVRLRGLAGAVEEGHAEAVGGPRAVAWRRASWSSASAPGCGSARGEYWDIEGTLRARCGRTRPSTSRATLVAVDGERVATGKDFDPATGQLARPRSCTSTRTAPAAWSPGSRARLHGRRRSRRSRTGASPTPPFMTSTLQQEARRKLRFSASSTMRVAQRLYENGYITYMRTDSTNLSETAHRRGAHAGPRAVRRRVSSRRAAPLRAAR